MNTRIISTIRSFEKEMALLSNEEKRALFANKTIYLNDDSPETSGLWMYFAQSMKHFGIKKVIATQYSNSKPIEKYEVDSNNIPEDENNPVNFIKTTRMSQNGHYNSDEVKQLTDKADIVVSGLNTKNLRSGIMISTMNSGKDYIVFGGKKLTSNII